MFFLKKLKTAPLLLSPIRKVIIGKPFEILQREWEQFRQESLEFLKKLAEEAKKEGVETEFTQLAGNPASSIVKFSQDWGAELIIMGRRGQATWKEIVLGSVSSYVIHRSHCAVHLVQT